MATFRYISEDDLIECRCADCRCTEQFSKGASTVTTAIAAFLKREAWRTVERNRLICPDCFDERARKRLVERIGDWIRRQCQNDADREAMIREKERLFR